MLISVAWLRALAPLPDDPAAVAAALTSRGLTVDAVIPHGAETVLDIDVPANRPDCLGHLGVAREAAAAFGVALRARPAPPPAAATLAGGVRVLVEAPDLCPRYTGRSIRGVRIAPSPDWVVERLQACGLRSVNNVVDVSNLVLLELGQPIHTFDQARIEGGEIRVRLAREDETIRTLDGVDRRLGRDMLVIADAAEAVAIAGVMGGARSEIAGDTRDVLVEAAWFLPRSVRQTARRLGLTTDSSQRFERGADPESTLAAQELAARLIVELAGGTADPVAIDVRRPPVAGRRLVLRHARAAALLGYAPSDAEVRGALAAVGLEPADAGPGANEIAVPSWRVDLEREADLVEEVGRHLGYDRIPSRASAFGVPAGALPRPDLEDASRDYLSQHGFLEAFSYAMIGAGDDDPFVEAPGAPLAVSNPIAEGLSILRRSVLPGLLRAANSNVRRGARDVRLFEVGRVFVPRGRGEFPREPRRVGLAWTGAAAPRHWSERSRDADLFDAAGVVEGLLRHLGLDAETRATPATMPGLHPGRSRAWTVNGGPALAWCGELHPEIASSLDLAGRLLLAEVDLDRLEAAPRDTGRYRPVPRFPAVTRDLSVQLPPHLRAEGLLRALRAVPAPAAAAFEAVDRYEGPPLPAGDSALTVRVMLQPAERTLTDAETEAYRAELVGALKAFGAKLRG